MTVVDPAASYSEKRPLEGKRILVTGGTGSLGQVLVRRILTGEWGMPKFIRVFSRDEGKQHLMRVSLGRISEEEAGLAYRSISGAGQTVQYVIGDVRDPVAIKKALAGVQIVFNAAALKQVPSCEYFPWEAVRTNVEGVQNLVNAVIESHTVTDVIGISTDKACKPVNVMGMTKAIQERIFQEANLHSNARFLCVRYGNVLASRGSVVPLFLHQILNGGPVTVTSRHMTRFFLTLDRAVDTVIAALVRGSRGDTWIPRVPSALIWDLAHQLVGAVAPGTPVVETEIRPGEKLHEELVSAEEAGRTIVCCLGYYAITSVLPEVRSLDRRTGGASFVDESYSSSDDVMSSAQVRELLARHRLCEVPEGEELLR